MSHITFVDINSDEIGKNFFGSLSVEEITVFLTEMGLDATECGIRKITEEMELEGDVEMEFNEFIQVIVEKVRKVNEGKAIYDMFQLFDKDGNGYISAQELRSVMQSLGENFSDEVIEEMIDEADMNGDNQIDFFEFVKILSIEDDITLFTNSSYQVCNKKEICSF